MDDFAAMGVSAGVGFATRKSSQMLGFAMSEYAKATAAAFQQKKEIHEAHEQSMEAAKGRGGAWLRIGIFGLISIGLLAGILAGFMDRPLVVEKEIVRNFLIWGWTSTKWVTVEGVPIFIEFKKGILSLMAFALGAAIK